MRFIIRSAQTSGCRRGAMVEFARHPDKVVETPACTLYTRGGSVPHLTPDIWEKLSNIPNMVQMPMPALVEHHEAVRKQKKGIGSFIALQDAIVFSTIQDTSAAVPQGYNDKNSVAVWARQGKYKLEVDHYMEIQEAFRPDVYQALSDGDTCGDTTRKRVRKSVDRTLGFLDSCLEKHQHSEVLKSSAIFGTIEGGHLLPERLRSARETATRLVDGFSLEGFHNFGPELENFDFKSIKELIQQTLSVLPSDKPCLLQGGWGPDGVMEAVSTGVDLFDSTYPFIATEKGEAIVFDFKYYDHQGAPSSPLDTKFTINLKDKRYCDDFSPVSPTCLCYCCQTFTRAYINHLLNTSELLAWVLLMIHNFHHYFEFFHTIRRSIDDNKFEDLKRLVDNQLPVKIS